MEGMPGETDLTGELGRLERLRPVFDAVASVEGPFDGVYLVGGTVRDILLGEQSFDVDIAVEGDAVAFAQALAERLSGEIRTHEAFGTAVVLYGEDGRVDVVTARKEHYDAPGALPRVERASITDDLFRRDFTVNAMGVALEVGDFGHLIDPFHGRQDLDARAIRVLHDRSFEDDPTRIFRAVRYENRHGFRMDDHTVALARQAIEQGLLAEVSPARVRDELMALFEEGDVAHALLRLGELGADRAIHPLLAADEQAVALLRRLVELRERYGLTVPSWRLGLAALARELPPEQAGEWLQWLKLRRQDAKAVEAAVAIGPQLAKQLGAQMEPAAVVALADPHAPDAPLFALALADLPQLHAYFERLRDVQLEVSGADLAELGLAESPRVGEVLAELRRRKLNGELDGRDSELAAARELIAG
jgi:tRNA nucleotidyltransferase (CCA-adding enzyme)